MSESPVDLIRRGYESFRRGDIPAVLDLFDEHIEWHEPDWTVGKDIAGVYHSPQEVAEKVFSAAQTEWDSFSLEPREYCRDGDNVFVQGEFRNVYKGREVVVPFLHAWTVRGSKVAKLHAYIDVSDLRKQAELVRAA